MSLYVNSGRNVKSRGKINKLFSENCETKISDTRGFGRCFQKKEKPGIPLASLFVYRKPLAGRVVQKRLFPIRKNKTPTVIVGMRSGKSKLQNRGRPFKNEVGETV